MAYPRTSEKLGTIRSTDGDVDVFLSRVREANGSAVWKFSSSLVGLIPSLYDEFGYGWLGEHVPERLRKMRGWNLESWQAIGLAVFVVFGWVVGWAGSRLVARVLKPFVRPPPRTSTIVCSRRWPGRRAGLSRSCSSGRRLARCTFPPPRCCG